MKHCGIPFAEERIRLRQPESREAILRHSPSGKVPALKANGFVVFDSLAILEYLAERHPPRRSAKSLPATSAASLRSGAGRGRGMEREDHSCSAPSHAPVATRFRTYGVDLAAFGDDGTAASYAETILALPEMAEWTAGAEAEIRVRKAG